MLAVDETIVAIASPPRGGPRGIVRLSGPQVIECLRGWFTSGRSNDSTEDWIGTKTATVISGQFRLDEVGRELPCDLYLWPTNRSYTKQPSAEIHTIGSPPLLQRIVSNTCETGARLARPGEFTMRAFLAGRLDLPQAEAVLGVIDARSDRQLDVALGQLAGGLSTQMHGLRDDLLNLVADLEAGLDFVEEDIAFVSAEDVQRRLDTAIQQVNDSIAQMKSRTVPTDVPRVALVGNPNVGKSTLFNALVGNDAAIVSDVAGTTRDYIRASVEVGGIPCELIDTAGIEPPLFGEDGQLLPSGHAQEMANIATQQATLLVLCIDMSRSPTAEERTRIAALDHDCELLIGTKSDLPIHSDITSGLNATPFDAKVHAGQGGGSLERLQTAIAERLAADRQLAGETVVSTALRCRRSLQDCESSLTRALKLCSSSAGDELIVAELRLALDAIGHVVGAVYTDDVLDRVFSRFCIGK